MNIFYTPELQSMQYEMTEEESKHCIRVLRKALGDKISLVDGKGTFFTAEIINDNPKHCVVAVIDKTSQVNRSEFINIAIAPTKNTDRIEWFLEKCTEIGINSIYLMKTENSERTNIKTERLEKLIISAMKQSLKAHKPLIHELITFNELLKATSGYAQKYIAYCDEAPEKVFLPDVYKKGSKTIVLIGPEGDFSATEVALAKKIGYKVVSLGESRLRTETAGMVACTIMNCM
ncbi:MAG: 16S rRNA (uracil(1498)-N(3))-methyltransferase [Bacteroidales bacterium]|nr:16S rRNA (uracil(1498)-N(3))-methyltransferase [Bacteroidales bacterium]